MSSRKKIRRLILSAPLVLLLGVASFAQNTSSDDSYKFLGKWVSDAELSGPDEMSSLPQTRIELQITRGSSGFTVERSDRYLNENQSDLSGEKSLFRYMNGRLERDSSAAHTWEPNEFPKRISETVRLLRNGKRLIFTTVLYSSGNTIIPGSNRKPLTLSIAFTRAKN